MFYLIKVLSIEIQHLRSDFLGNISTCLNIWAEERLQDIYVCYFEWIIFIDKRIWFTKFSLKKYNKSAEITM